MPGVFDTLAPLRTSAEMAAHVNSIIRNFPPCERADVAEELIDRAERRGAIDAGTAASLMTTIREEIRRFSR